MKKILMILFVAAVSMMTAGCAMAPRAKVWAENPTSYETVTIRWHREAGKGYLDTEGTCNVQAVDDEDAPEGLAVVYSQIVKCRLATERLPVTDEAKKIEKKQVRIYIVGTPSDVVDRLIDYKGWTYYKAVMKASGTPAVCGFRTGHACIVMAGFYMWEPEWYGIVIAKDYLSGVGHELKHVYDGAWHTGGSWRHHAGKVIPGELKTQGVAAN